MVKLAACLCFKNSASYLAEWLAYHRTMGVERFYLYDNGSTDDFGPVIAPYLAAGIAHVTRWPGAGQQELIYQNCLIRARGEAEWVAFLDDDEFLYPISQDSLVAALEPYAAHAGVAVSWFLFGSSGHEQRPAGGVLENYTRRATAVDKHVKCVVQPLRIKGPQYIGHVFVAEPGYAVVDEHRRPVVQCPHDFASGDILRVNHYATKSIEEVRARRSRARADSGRLSEHGVDQWVQWAREWNDTEDRGIQRFLPRVKAELAKSGLVGP